VGFLGGLSAERRAGELLAEIERKQTAGLKKGSSPSRHDGATGYRETIKAAEIPETTARRWQAEASIPEAVSGGATGRPRSRSSLLGHRAGSFHGAEALGSPGAPKRAA
jgi:hypothetical protein